MSNIVLFEFNSLSALKTELSEFFTADPDGNVTEGLERAFEDQELHVLSPRVQIDGQVKETVDGEVFKVKKNNKFCANLLCSFEQAKIAVKRPGAIGATYEDGSYEGSIPQQPQHGYRA